MNTNTTSTRNPEPTSNPRNPAQNQPNREQPRVSNRNSNGRQDSSGSTGTSSSPNSTKPLQRFRFEKLEVWHTAKELTVRVDQALRRPGRDASSTLNEAYGRWLVKSSFEVADAIAEGSNHYGDASMIDGLELARSEIARLGSQLHLCEGLGLLQSETTEELLQVAMSLNSRIKGLQRAIRNEGQKSSGGQPQDHGFDTR